MLFLGLKLRVEKGEEDEKERKGEKNHRKRKSRERKYMLERERGERTFGFF